jgi:hypothetical protein
MMDKMFMSVPDNERATFIADLPAALAHYRIEGELTNIKMDQWKVPDNDDETEYQKQRQCHYEPAQVHKINK